MWLWCVDCPSARSSAGVTSLKWELCPFQISGTWRSVCALPLSCQVYLLYVVFIQFIIFTSISGVIILCVFVCTGHYIKISIRINWHTHIISVLLAFRTYNTRSQLYVFMAKIRIHAQLSHPYSFIFVWFLTAHQSTNRKPVVLLLLSCFRGKV